MNSLTTENTIGSILVTYPHLARVFEEEGLDYCCGGKKSLKEACAEKGQDPEELLVKLQETAKKAGEDSSINPAALSLSELADHIERTHHALLREELPRLKAITERVAMVHGGNDPRLVEVKGNFVELAQELTQHMMKEEKVLFPLIREIDISESLPTSHCGSVESPIQQMEHEHDDAGSALSKLRELTDDYNAPQWACNTYRVMLDGLKRLEKDLHAHIHKENNILFPRALERERTLRGHS